MLTKIEQLIERPLFKAGTWLIAALFFGGIAFNKWEYKMSQMPKEIASELIKQLSEIKEKQSEHIIVDLYEKKIINSRIDNITAELKELKDDLKNRRQISEFVRPNQITELERKLGKRRR